MSLGWRDVNKDDDYLCCAAAASNILDWGLWHAGTSSADEKFGTFKAHWTGQGSWPRYGWDWLITGNNPLAHEGWAQVDVPGAGGYYSNKSFDSIYGEWGFGDSDSEPAVLDLVAVEIMLRNDYGVVLSIRNFGYHHALTVWGIEYETDFYTNPYRYAGLWVTDSDDDASQLVHFTARYLEDDWLFGDVWWLTCEANPRLQGWIPGVQGLKSWEPEVWPPQNRTPRIMDLNQYGFVDVPLVEQRLYYATNYRDIDLPLDPQPVPGPTAVFLSSICLAVVGYARARFV